MKCLAKSKIEYHLTMTEEEGKWLKSLAKKAIHHEDEEGIRMCKRLFHAITLYREVKPRKLESC